MEIFRQNNCRQKKADHYFIIIDGIMVGFFCVCKHSMGLKKLLYSIIIINIKKKRFGGSKKGIRFSKKFFETHRKPHGYWVPVISVTKDRLSLDALRVRTFSFIVTHLCRQSNNAPACFCSLEDGVRPYPSGKTEEMT